MSKIECPHCKTAFTVDEAGYAALLGQVRNKEFEKEIADRLKAADNEKMIAIDLAKSEATNALAQTSADKDAEISDLKAKIELSKSELTNKLQKSGADKDAEISELKAKLSSISDSTELKISTALAPVEKMNTEKDAEIASLKSKMLTVEAEHKLAVSEAVGAVEKDRDTLQNELKHSASQRQIAETALTEKYETKIKDRDDAIERLRDMKARQSTKMVGESLEIHCETEFNRIRQAAFPQAYFEKDNEIVNNSKGDYVFRDLDESGEEIVSIMFEMKNEMDTTATKKKNEDFFKELDKDRTDKGCEYAILVSLLESDSELYNTGILDVSHRYPKMFVVRPQFFLQIITLLRNASAQALKYKKELKLVKAQHIDITNFEENLDTFKVAFGKNYDLASRGFQTAIDEIDKSIDHLEKTKKALTSSERNLRLANDKAQTVSVKRLTKNNPTMARKFDDIRTTAISR